MTETNIEITNVSGTQEKPLIDVILETARIYNGNFRKLPEFDLWLDGKVHYNEMTFIRNISDTVGEILHAADPSETVTDLRRAIVREVIGYNNSLHDMPVAQWPTQKATDKTPAETAPTSTNGSMPPRTLRESL